MEKSNFFEILCILRKKQCHGFVRGAPYVQYFQNVKCPDSSCFFFDFLTFTQNVCIKRICSRNFRCSVKEAVLLLRSWGTRYVTISKCIVSLLTFFFVLIPEISHLQKSIFLEVFWCSAKEAVLLLRSCSTLYVAFSKCKAF